MTPHALPAYNAWKKVSPMMPDAELSARMLYKLIRRNKWNASHTPEELLKWGIPPELRGRAKELTKSLVRKGWLLVKKTGHGDDVYLNIDYAEEIKAFVEKALPTVSHTRYGL